MERLMSLRKFVQQIKTPVQEKKVEPITRVSDFLSEALVFKGGNDEQFAWFLKRWHRKCWQHHRTESCKGTPELQNSLYHWLECRDRIEIGEALVPA